MKHCIDQYGNVVTNQYDRIRVSVSGSGKEVILILGRKTSPSSIIELKPLSSFLEDNYMVVTMNYLGSDSSDNYHTNRTLENITNEIHEVMELLNQKKYTIAAIAYSGLYALYYANKYADEVNAVIGIDSFVSKQRHNKSYMDRVRFINDFWLEFHGSKGAVWLVEKLAELYIKKAKRHYKYADNDIEEYSNHASYMLENMTLLDRYKCPDENFETLDNMIYPSHIPVLFILSSHRCRMIRGWYEMHKKIVQSSNCKIIILRGEKNLHMVQPEKVASQIKDFLNQNE